MKIAMIGSRGIGTSYGGIERVLDAVSPELVALGHTVDVFASDCPASIDLPGLNVVRVPSIGGKHTETISRSSIALARAMGRYDVIHLHAIGPGMLSAVTRLFAQPTIVTVHGLDQKRDKWGPVARSCLSMAENMIARYADEVTVVSEELRRYFLERYNLRTVFIPNGLPSVKPVPRGPFLDSLGLENRRYVFFASRLTPEKGCHDLIEAHARLEDGTALVIAGKGIQSDYDAYLRQIAGNNVMFVGHRSGAELQELYSNAAAFVLPSYLEGMSMALLEAMAYGLPLVVSDIPENVRVVGGGAIRFAPRDVNGLHNALQLAVERRIQPAAQQSAWPTWSKIAESYSNSYHRVVGKMPVVVGELYGDRF